MECDRVFTRVVPLRLLDAKPKRGGQEHYFRVNEAFIAAGIAFRMAASCRGPTPSSTSTSQSSFDK